jgi:FixJ family two-component response regulator
VTTPGHPPDEQAMFRLDFAAWLNSLTTRERQIVRAMARNERTRDLSQQFGVSPSRISQLRRDFALSWQDFCADAEPGQAKATA